MNEKAIRAQLRTLGLPQPSRWSAEDGSPWAEWVVLDGCGQVLADRKEVTFEFEDGVAYMDYDLLSELLSALRAARVWHQAVSDDA